jgi:hypothetical protein
VVYGGTLTCVLGVVRLLTGHVCIFELWRLISYVWWTLAYVFKVPGLEGLPNVSNLGYHCRDSNSFDVKLWSVAEWASP